MKKIAVLIAAALAPVAFVNVAHADAALATAKGCTACHQVEKKVIGPAYNAVAACYASKDAKKAAANKAALVKHVKEGGAGGKGTATEGIAGVGTKGRSSGQGEYGELGSGGKGSVSIVSEGEGAGFTGGLDKAGIRRTVQSIIGQIRSCYEKGLRAQSSLEGRLVIQFEIDDKGLVVSSKVGSSSLNDSEVGPCVANRVRAQRFPPSPRGVVGVVDYPFVFGAQK